MYLVFDTETTGLPNFKAPADDPSQPHICQLAFVLLDKSFEEVACFKSLRKLHDGVVMDEGAQKAHGLTIEQCNVNGLPISSLLDVFEAFYRQSEFRVAHNLAFDSKLLNIENTRYGKYYYDWKNQQTNICTMLVSTPICKVPHPTRAGNKWPKLQEAYEFFYGEQFSGAHDALVDVRATAKVLRKLAEDGYLDDIIG
jgi:DNA polymerase-3 subunit epsilon